MRTIKFRAWHKGKGWADEVAVYHDGSWSATYGQVSGYDDKDGVLLMQCTGLVDKAGKEVYEGDIYRNLDNGLIGKFYYLNGPGGYALHTRENNADGSPYNMLPFAQLDTTNFEVIGNIYETPELLEVNHAQS